MFPVIIAPRADNKDVEPVRFPDQQPAMDIGFQERDSARSLLDAAMVTGGVCHGAGVVVGGADHIVTPHFSKSGCVWG